MPSTHITIDTHNGESSTQTIGTPQTEMASVDFTQKPKEHLNQSFVSKVSRTLSLDSSIPVLPSMTTSTMAPVHEGSGDKLPLHGGLKDPIWVTPTVCPHRPTNGEICSLCKKETSKRLEKPERTPDFTVLNLYGPRRPAKKCKCGLISTLTICFSVFVSVFILALVIYCEFIKAKSPDVHYKM